MIVKYRTKPRKLEFNEALLGRLRSNHPSIPVIEEDIRKNEAGYIGEQRLDYFLNYLPDKDYNIIQGLRLYNGKSHYQIDTLIITPSYLLIIEAKNMKGDLTFEKDQLIQEIDNNKIAYDDPLLQAQFQLRQLRDLLKKHQFPSLPLEYLVMMSNTKAILKIADNQEARYRVCRGRRVVLRVEEFTKKYRDEKLTSHQVRKLIRLLLKNDIEPSYDVETCYKISRGDYLTGVHCPSCNFLPTAYQRGGWLCPKCGGKSNDAHFKALKDYYLIYGPTITNQQFREFLRLPSMNIASKILTSLNFPYSGSKKHRVYQIKIKNLD